MKLLRRPLAIAKNDLEILSHDPLIVIVLVGMPLVVMAFVKPALRLTLVGQGFRGANGAEQVVPGMSLMFAFFIIEIAGLAFFREHTWNTWDRVRATPSRAWEIFAGKLLPVVAIIAVQQFLLFLLGIVAFDLHVRGSPLALVLVDVSYGLCLVGLALAAVAYATSYQQILTFANLGLIVFAALGGALTPIGTLPGWARHIAPATPTYWGMRGFRSVLLGGQGLSAIVLPCAVLVAIGVVGAVLSGFRFRFEDPKPGYV